MVMHIRGQKNAMRVSASLKYLKYLLIINAGLMYKLYFNVFSLNIQRLATSSELNQITFKKY